MSHSPREFILQDVRCFQDEQRGRIKPITLLVGENSTGKTAFLGCYSVLHQLFTDDLEMAPIESDFNKDPFSMGSFQDIANSRRGAKSNIKQFKLGLEFSSPTPEISLPYSVIVTFSEVGSQANISSIRFQFKEQLFFELNQNDSGKTTISTPKGEFQTKIPFNRSHHIFSLIFYWKYVLSQLGVNFQPINEFFDELFVAYGIPADDNHREIVIGNLFPEFANLVPIAPLRAKPKRTYDPIREIPSAEGSHIPMLMMRLDRTDKESWKSLQDSLVNFGQGSGLFSNIKVNRRGKDMSDPFQLQVKVRSGHQRNIMDVGYGVSQSLPIIVDVLAAEEQIGERNGNYCTFLMQQPEVHLHPRAQAELASFFADSYSKRNNRFMIETHSDAIIDRFRILVRTGLLAAEDVSILYFEPQKTDGVKIHNISLDMHGNLEDAPPGYRDFFLAENDRILGFSD